MEEFKFKSLNELFNRLYPAFNAKVNELKNENILVTEIILWNYSLVYALRIFLEFYQLFE